MQGKHKSRCHSLRGRGALETLAKPKRQRERGSTKICNFVKKDSERYDSKAVLWRW